MNIAIINSLAKTKSTGKIAYGLYQWLQKKHNVVLYYGRQDEVEKEENIVRVESNAGNYIHAGLSRLFGDQGYHSSHATKKMITDMKKRRIEVVYLLNIHGYYLNYKMMFDYFSSQGIKIIYLMLDESAFRGKCCASNNCNKYKNECKDCPLVNEYPKSFWVDKSNDLFRLKMEAYRNNNITFVGINYTVNVAKEAALTQNAKFEVVDEAVDINHTYFPRETTELKKHYNISEDKVIIMGMGPYSNQSKGGRFLIQAAERMRGNDRVCFIFPAFDGDRSICPPNFVPIDYIYNSAEMAKLYSLADLFVCTSYSETVANTCIEALACGTKIVVFNACGMPDCADAEHSTVLEVGDVNGMVKIFSNTKKKSNNDILSCREYAVKRYDSDLYFNKLEELAKRID